MEVAIDLGTSPLMELQPSRLHSPVLSVVCGFIVSSKCEVLFCPWKGELIPFRDASRSHQQDVGKIMCGSSK
jgi:hypothetical protein